MVAMTTEQFIRRSSSQRQADEAAEDSASIVPTVTTASHSEHSAAKPQQSSETLQFSLPIASQRPSTSDSDQSTNSEKLETRSYRELKRGKRPTKSQKAVAFHTPDSSIPSPVTGTATSTPISSPSATSKKTERRLKLPPIYINTTYRKIENIKASTSLPRATSYRPAQQHNSIAFKVEQSSQISALRDIPNKTSMTDSESSRPESEDFRGVQHHRTVFICGFIPKRWHNSSLQAVIHDLLPKFYVACNNETWDETSSTRNLLANADAMLFFVNEFTLGDSNCLLTLQYAWHLMVPIIMLRPPRTKLVICKREDRRDDIMIIGQGSIIRSPSTRWALLENTVIDNVDYGLLQDILYEGYKLSVVYDRLDHRKSMVKINERLQAVLRPTRLDSSPNPSVNGMPSFYLSSTNESRNSIAVTTGATRLNLGHDLSPQQPETASKIRSSQSMSCLNNNIPQKGNRSHKDRRSSHTKHKRTKSVKTTTDEENSDASTITGRGQLGTESTRTTDITSQRSGLSRLPSTMSRTSSLERRMSLSSIDDLSNYQQTQYLVFPLRDNNKKPVLIKFPEDLLEEQYKDDNVWGSDTSLEEEALIAPTINGGIMSFDNEDDSPIMTPAPYIEDLL